MRDQQGPTCIRVVYSTGDAFHTRASSASEYVLDPVFLQFIAISVLLFASLMMVLEVPFAAQMIFFGAAIVSSFFWMIASIFIYLLALKSLQARTIYTPVLLLPMHLINAATIEVVLRYFDSSYLNDFNSVFELTVRTLIILVCLDIFHGKFVAQHHKLYVPKDEAEAPIPDEQRQPEAVQPPSPHTSIGQPVSANFSISQDASAVHLDVAEPATSSTYRELRIGSEVFDVRKLQCIKSEDHYLMVYHGGKSTMVRGRLRDAASQIDAGLGLQINRSVWIAYSAIVAIKETSDKRLDVYLDDDTVHRVSESRKVHFLHSYEAFNKAPDAV